MSQPTPKPCPQCGYVPDPQPYGPHAGKLAGRFHVRDPNCELSMPPEHTREEAVRCWNLYHVMSDEEFEAWNERSET